MDETGARLAQIAPALPSLTFWTLSVKLASLCEPLGGIPAEGVALRGAVTYIAGGGSPR